MHLLYKYYYIRRFFSSHFFKKEKGGSRFPFGIWLPPCLFFAEEERSSRFAPPQNSPLMNLVSALRL